MRKKIDCLFIEHNESHLNEYEKQVRKIGVNSGATRCLNTDFIRYNKTHYRASEIFNLLHPAETKLKGYKSPLSQGDNGIAVIAYLGTYLHRRGFNYDYVNSFQEEKGIPIEKLVGEDIKTIAVEADQNILDGKNAEFRFYL